MRPVPKVILNGLLALGLLFGAACLKWGQSTPWIVPAMAVACLAAYLYLFMRDSPD